MMDDQKKNNESAPDPFEDNLRQILSNDNLATDRCKSSVSAASASAPAPELSAVVPDQEAIDRMKSERRLLFFFKVLRPVAAVATLLALMLFVKRITSL